MGFFKNIFDCAKDFVAEHLPADETRIKVVDNTGVLSSTQCEALAEQVRKQRGGPDIAP